MALEQGVKPCVVVPKKLHRLLRGDLFALGYKPHVGPRSKRGGEIQAWVAPPLGSNRQIPVQEERLEDGDIAVFAHTFATESVVLSEAGR